MKCNRCNPKMVPAESAHDPCRIYRTLIKNAVITVCYELGMLHEKTWVEFITSQEVTGMKARIITTAAVIGLMAALSSGDVFAAGNGHGGGRGQGSAMKQQAQTRSQSHVASGTTQAARPAGSQRRDGTFLTTGVTANGSTTRPGNGNGLQDGSHLTTAVVTPPAVAP